MAKKTGEHETAQRQPRARKTNLSGASGAPELAGAPQGPVSGHDANERPISGGESERARVPQPHGGVLTPFAPGVSGNPHRGPDRCPHVIQAQFLVALAESQVRKVKTEDGKTKTVVVETRTSSA